jgi:hypothetical protein
MRFDPGNVRPPEKRVLARSGCPPSRTNDFREMAAAACDLVQESAEPLALFRTMEIRKLEAELVDAGEITFRSRSLSRFIEDAGRLTVFLVTLGEGPEGDVRRLQKAGKHTDALFADSASSCMVEETARSLQRRLSERFSNYVSTGRYAPGFGDLALSCQREILTLVEGESEGVTLQPDSMMIIPVKSGTGVIGWIPQVN